MKNILFLALSFFSISFWSLSTAFSQGVASSASCDESSIRAIQWEAVSLMKAKQFDEAALLYGKITARCPDNAKAYMDYGQTLFASASKYFNKNRSPMFEKDALPILQEAASSLRKAVSLFADDSQSVFWKSHAYYLLGDIYHYGLINLDEARKMYLQSLSFVPDNTVVKKELENIHHTEMGD